MPPGPPKMFARLLSHIHLLLQNLLTTLNSVTLTVAATSITARLFIDARMSPSVLSRSFGSSLNRLASSSCSQHASSWHFVSAWDISVADLKVSQRRLNVAHSSAVAPPAIRGLSTFGGLCFWVALLWTFVWCSCSKPRAVCSESALLTTVHPGNSQRNSTAMVGVWIRCPKSTTKLLLLRECHGTHQLFLYYRLGKAHERYYEESSCIMKKTPRSNAFQMFYSVCGTMIQLCNNNKT